MKNLRQKLTSRTIFVIRILTLIIVSGFVTIPILKLLPNFANFISFIIIYGLIFYILYKKSEKFEQAIIDFKINAKGLSIKWEKQFIFQNKPNEFIEWCDIKNYTYQPEQYFNLFKIKLNNGKEYKFSFIDYTSDFYRFYLTLEKKTEKKSLQSEKINITRGKTIYETTYGKISAIILLLIIPFMAYKILFDNNMNNSNHYLVLITLSSGIFFIIQVYQNYRKNKKR